MGGRYPLRLTEDGSLVLYEYAPRDSAPWFGLFFYSHFLPVWSLSFVAPAVVGYWLWTGQHWAAVVAYAAAAAWYLWPRPRGATIFPWLQLVYFFELPRYYAGGASFRVERPAEHPQLARLLQLFENVTEWQQDAHGRRYKELCLSARGILDAARAVDPRRLPTDIFCCAPHGLIAVGWGQLCFCPFFNDVWNCVSSLLYYLGHLICAYSSCLGLCHPATAASITQTLARGESISIIPGGFEEATLLSYKCDKLFLRKRWGVFRLAAKFNAGLVPLFAFGETHSFKNLQGCTEIRTALNKWSIPGVLCVGRFLWFPYRCMMHVVIGARVVPEHGESVEHLKDRYITGLQNLHARYGPYFYQKEHIPLQIL